jgi:hypothetical protein
LLEEARPEAEKWAARHQARREDNVAGQPVKLATTTLHLAFRAAASAAASWGLRSSASAPLPDSGSTYSAIHVKLGYIPEDSG